MCYPVSGMVHIKELLLPIGDGKSCISNMRLCEVETQRFKFINTG